MGQDLLGDAFPGQGHRLGTELLCKPQRLGEARARLLGHSRGGTRIYKHHDPFRAQRVGEALGCPDDLDRMRTGTDAGHDPFGHRPGLANGVVPHVNAHLRVHPIRRPPQGQFAERDQVPLPKEVLDGFPRLLGDVDLPLLQSLQQLVRREIDQHDFVCLLQDHVGDCLTDHQARDLGDHIAQAFQMLDVEGRVDVDPGVQELHDILPALGVTSPGEVGVGEFIHQDQGGTARQGRVQVELLAGHATPNHSSARQSLQTPQQALGLGTSVGVHPADQHVHAFGPAFACGLEHGVGFSDARYRAEEDLESPANLPAHVPWPAPGASVGFRLWLVCGHFICHATIEGSSGRLYHICPFFHPASARQQASTAPHDIRSLDNVRRRD